jgi:hypothetical protein
MECHQDTKAMIFPEIISAGKYGLMPTQGG